MAVVADPLQQLALGEVDQLKLLRRVEHSLLQGEHDRNRFGFRPALRSLHVGNQVLRVALALFMEDLGLGDEVGADSCPGEDDRAAGRGKT
ncbi:hypothetical protein AB0D47_39315 [Streptomyces sp. NPDC048376]|uniref:hypothetical protein n=1 Tax=unclassified Streptomyces TaxID=2593676 RepID=UPI00341E670F